MKHAIILAHPNPSSFNASVARTCAATLRSFGHEVLLRDLYQMKFDPCLRQGEIPSADGFAPAKDVAEERARLAEVAGFILVYPFWFNAPPAILKGYVDRVFSMNFGYRPEFGGVAPLLTGKTLLSISTSGAPDQWVQSTGALVSLMKVFDLHLAGVCGLTIADHVHLGGVVANMVEESGDELLEEVRARLQACFDPSRAERRLQS